MVSALNRLEEIRSINVGELSLAGIPQSRIKTLARHAAAVRTQAIARMPDERRIATLLAFAREFEIRAMDDALDLLDLLMTEIMREAENTGKKERIRTLRDLDAAALCLVAGMNIILNETYDDAELRKVIFAQIPKDRRAYTLCVLEQLVDNLRRRDVFVEKSDRWCDPRSKLLSGKDWEVARPKILKALGRSSDAKEEIAALFCELDTAYRRTAENFPANAAIRIEPKDGRDTLTVTGLDKLEEPSSLIVLREQMKDLLPRNILTA